MRAPSFEGMKALSSLLESPGWAILVEHATEQLDADKDRLVKASLENVPRLQERAQACEKLILIPSELLREWKKALGEK